jgi:hypothetical protein
VTRRRLGFALVMAALFVLGAPGTAAAPGPTPPPSQGLPTPTPMATLPAPAPLPQPGPDANSGMGVEGLVPQPPIRHGNQQFLFERFAPYDYTNVHVDPVGIAQSAIGSILGFSDPAQLAMNVSLNAAASVVLGFLVLTGFLTIRLLAWSLQVDLLASADGPLNAVVGGLVRDLYQPLVPLLLTLVAGWLIWTWLLRRRTMRGVVGIGWVFLAMTLSAIYFAAPSQILDQGSAFTAGISRAVLATVGGADTQLHRGDPTVAQGPADDAELRLFSDRYWTNYVYTPWTIVQFGQLDPKNGSGQPLGVELLKKYAGQPSTFDQDLQQQPLPVRDWYDGAQGGSRLVVALAALLVGLAAGLVFLAAAVVRLACSVLFLALLMTLPIFLLMALHPTIGRKLLVRWIELAVGTLWRQIIYSLFLAIMVVLVGVISAASAAGGWGVVTLCQLAVMAAILIFRKPLLAIFGQLGGGRHFTKLEHVGSSRFAEKTHQTLGAGRERFDRRYPIPAFARRGRPAAQAEGAAGKADKAVKAAKAAKKTKTATEVAAMTGKTAAGGWVTLAAAAAMKGGQMAIRKGETAKRQLQGAASPFLLDGKAGAPPPRRMPEKSLGVDGGELRGYAWRRIRRQPEPTPAVEEPKAKPKRQKALPDGGGLQPRRSLPRARWSRQPGGGHVLDVLRRKS